MNTVINKIRGKIGLKAECILETDEERQVVWDALNALEKQNKEAEPVRRGQRMNELKPCPFCGGEAELKRKQFAEDASEAAWIECKSCGAMSTVWTIELNRIPPRARTGDAYFTLVRNAWNRRTEDNE